MKFDTELLDEIVGSLTEHEVFDLNDSLPYTQGLIFEYNAAANKVMQFEQDKGGYINRPHELVEVLYDSANAAQEHISQPILKDTIIEEFVEGYPALVMKLSGDEYVEASEISHDLLRRSKTYFRCGYLEDEDNKARTVRDLNCFVRGVKNIHDAMPNIIQGGSCLFRQKMETMFIPASNISQYTPERVEQFTRLYT